MQTDHLIRDTLHFLWTDGREWLLSLEAPFNYVAWAFLALIALWVLRGIFRFIGLFYRGVRRGRIDPVRLFTREQNAMGHRRAGSRCELESFWGVRCHARSAHGDHYFPHSKGGATSMTNYVAACAKHNMRKSAKVPTFGERMRLQMRRRFYFPKGVPTTAGQWR